MVADLQLQQAIDGVATPGILIGHRIIREGDEFALLPEEAEAIAASVVKVRRASGAGRVAARALLQRLGQAPRAVGRSASGMPVWPQGVVGSLAHDAEVAIAAVARRDDFATIGIDVEPAAALDPGLFPMVATPRERQVIGSDPLGGRLLFCIKEAVYKASYPLDGTFLEHHDVEVDFAANTAVICSGRALHFRCSATSHIVAVAYVAAGNSRA